MMILKIAILISIFFFLGNAQNETNTNVTGTTGNITSSTFSNTVLNTTSETGPFLNNTSVSSNLNSSSFTSSLSTSANSAVSSSSSSDDINRTTSQNLNVSSISSSYILNSTANSSTQIENTTTSSVASKTSANPCGNGVCEESESAASCIQDCVGYLVSETCRSLVFDQVDEVQIDICVDLKKSDTNPCVQYLELDINGTDFSRTALELEEDDDVFCRNTLGGICKFCAEFRRTNDNSSYCGHVDLICLERSFESFSLTCFDSDQIPPRSECLANETDNGNAPVTNKGNSYIEVNQIFVFFTIFFSSYITLDFIKHL